MATEELSTRVRDFLRAYIHSVAQIDILTIMCRAPASYWTARAVDEVLCHDEGEISRRLVEFARAGIIIGNGESPPAYQCQNFETPLGAALRETVDAYVTRPVKVIETIFKPQEDAAQQFADAFRIRPTDHA
ncbi:MAG: hypothetical protein V4675_01195 [Verrucomicrobiota bacterium]